MENKILITGGAGFIGSYLTRYLLNKSYEIIVFDDFSRGNIEKISDIKDDIKIINGNICNKNDIQKALDGVNYIFHLAAINGTKYFYEKPEKVLEVNTKGVINILDLAVEKGIKNILFASSSEVYHQPEIIPTPESIPLIIPDVANPRYSYSGSKIIGELFCINYAKKYNLDVKIIRPHNIYGPDMGFEHVIPEFVLRLKEISNNFKINNIDFHIQGSGDETRAFCYIDDAVEEIYLVAEKGKKNNIYNIGNDKEEISIKELAKIVAQSLDVDILIKSDKNNFKEGGTKRRCPDISRIKEFGFEPKILINEGVFLTSEWYKKIDI